MSPLPRDIPAAIQDVLRSSMPVTADAKGTASRSGRNTIGGEERPLQGATDQGGVWFEENS